MVIDIHTHLWPFEKSNEAMKQYLTNRISEYEFTADGLLKSMENAGIDMSVISTLAFDSQMDNGQIDLFNRFIADTVKHSDGKLEGFCTINPFEKGAGKYLRKCIEEYEMKGLKLHCNIQEFYPNDPVLDSVYGIMQEYGLPILFHSGGIGVRPYKDVYGRPILHDETAIKFPELKIILGHAGRIWYDETAMLLRKHKNIYADISTNFGKTEETINYPIKKLLEITKGWAGNTEHLLFGSDFPFYGQTETMKNLKLMMKEHKEEIIVANEDIENIYIYNTQLFWDSLNLNK
ncbi:Predicted metal-dependent hydrolase, TIM-barrel fold [Anaerobium acetethylicum]|uniref:Predicted metal-dependent hydrolase, TIM-barrel fold n=2 Tax=Anaerobium acetethylicum TaxID=1619234 RepID=A0A1D3TXA9_9FIRM|nr:Predicted metal-dependent hydrolase, TIM-barrel fold [Anaerobium acetethylicum]